MPDYSELMHILSKPRPNGSAAERSTRQALQAWLEARSIPHRLHSFKRYPHFNTAIGVWLIFSRSLLALAIWLRWGWPAALIAFLGLPGGLLDVALGIPLVTWPGADRGENILIEFEPPNPEKEMLLSAHYDSKTELLDHHQRLFFIRKLPLGILLTVLLGLLGPLDSYLMGAGSPWARLTYSAGALLSLALLFLAWGLGLNLSLGCLRRPSQGAVDNGAACAILLGLAESLQNGRLPLERTRLVLALFTAEEVNMQGSRAYASQRAWALPAIALNLEVMAQDGDYVYWEQDGSSLKLAPTSPEVNHRIAQSVAEVVGLPAHPAGPVNSDGYSFLRMGIPTTTLGTYDTEWGERGFHGPADNLERVVMARLPEAVEILAHFVRKYDAAKKE
ncbi:MAG: M28 family peptidase [Anaerolineales bacterium]|nr:M28 family peptidase [Anaerolineales bacterium]